MARTVLTLPDDQLLPLKQAYGRAISAKRRTTLIGLGVVLVLIVLAGFEAQVRPSTFLDNIGNFTSYLDRISRLDDNSHVWTNIPDWFWGWKRWLRLLGETLLMAYLGTLLGAIGGFVLSFLSVANLTSNAWARILAKRFLEFCRTVPDLVYTLIYVVAFGLGAMPGVLAIASHTVGALGKQYADVVENIDMKPVEGARASGGSWSEVVRFAALPQILSNFASYTLLRFEINVRSAGVIGMVGAGGIGQEIMTSIRRFQYPDISALLVLIIVTVIIIDILTGRLRHSLLGTEKRR